MAVALEREVRLPTRDAGALTASLYKQHAGELLRFAWHRLGRVEDAEDAVQATFLSAHRVLQEGERVREPRAWLFRILRNECLTRIATVKRRGVHESLEEWHADSGPSVEEAFERKDEFDATVALLGTLPVQQREAMVLREWIGLSAIEASEVLETTPQGVDALVYRARKSLVAVPEVEDDSDCADVRAALADDAVTARTRAHLLRCRSCRAAARRLRAPEELAANGGLPLDMIASRLGDSIPGFAVGAGTVALATGGGVAAAASSAAGASVAVKVVVGVTATAVVAGGAVGGVPVVRDAVRPAPQVQAERVTQREVSAPIGGGAKVTIVDAVKATQAQAASPERATTPVAAAAAFPAEAVADPAVPAPVDGSAPTDPAQPVAAAPVEGQPAAEADRPKAPEGSRDPSPAKQPASVAKPEDARKPEEAKKPEAGKKPEEAKQPAAPKPEDAKKPEAGKKPEEAKQPAAVAPKPEEAKKPEAGKKPEEAKQPAAVAPKPEDAKKPETGKKPEAGKKPEDAKKPEESSKPGDGQRSEPVAAPVPAAPAAAKPDKPSEAKPDKGKKQDDD